MAAPHLSRRSVLAGGAALAFAAACGSGDDGGSSSSTTGSAGNTSSGTLLSLIPQQGVLTTGAEQRLPVAVADPQGIPITEGAGTMAFELRSEEGDPIALEVEPHADGIPTPYYPVRFTVEQAGLYELAVAGDAGFNTLAFEVGTETAIPSVGQSLPPLDTPTMDDPRGVTPICTREPACALHDVTLREALGGGPVAFLIATPEFCQVAICGPVLDVLVGALADFPSITGVHAEVYADPRGDPDPTAGGLAPAPEAYALTFEPSLFIADATGTITARLDNAYDRVELGEALSAVA